MIDKKKGLSFLFQAADMGNPKAQLSLAIKYARGVEGYLERDVEKSQYYLELAEKNPIGQEIPGFIDEIDLARKDLGYPE